MKTQITSVKKVREASDRPASSAVNPAVPPGLDRANENYREQAVAQTETTPPDANAHIREKPEPKDQAPPREKDERNPANPKRGFDRGDSRSQPGNYHPYHQGVTPPGTGPKKI